MSEENVESGVGALATGQVAGAAREGAADTEDIPQSRGHGRRVTLVRSRDGQYQIWRLTRLIQTFCSDWEDVTRFQLPEGIEQQIRIHIQVVGEAQIAREQVSAQLEEERAEVAMEGPLEIREHQQGVPTPELRRIMEEERISRVNLGAAFTERNSEPPSAPGLDTPHDLDSAINYLLNDLDRTSHVLGMLQQIRDNSRRRD